MAFLRQLELPAIFLLPLLAVLIGYETALLPKGARRRLDRLLLHRLQIHVPDLGWSILAPDGSMIRCRRVRASRWDGGSVSISAEHSPTWLWSTKRPAGSASPRSRPHRGI